MLEHTLSISGFNNSQCKLVPVFPNFLDVVLQVVEEQLHHVQFLLRPPERAHEQITIRTTRMWHPKLLLWKKGKTNKKRKRGKGPTW